MFMRSELSTVSHNPILNPFDSRLKFQTTGVPQLQLSRRCDVGYTVQWKNLLRSKIIILRNVLGSSTIKDIARDRFLLALKPPIQI